MADKFPNSQLPIRRSVELLPVIFQTPANDKFLSAVVDPLIQPGVLDKVVGYVGRRYDKTYNGKDVTTVQHTAFIIAPSTGTMNGSTITVYGYRKA